MRLLAACALSLGILLGTACAPPSGSSPTTTVNMSKCKTERDTIETAVEAYAISEGHFPESLQTLLDAQYLKERYVTFDWTYEVTDDGFALIGPC